MSAMPSMAAESKLLLRQQSSERGNFGSMPELEDKPSTPLCILDCSKPQPPPTAKAYPQIRPRSNSSARDASASCAKFKRSLKEKAATLLCCQAQTEDHPNRSWDGRSRVLSDFSVGKQLGEGASAQVYEGLDTEFGVRVALKLVGLTTKKAPGAALMTPAGARASAAAAFANEKNALEAVSSPHVLGLLSSSVNENHKGRRASLLVLERCPNGELYNVMEKLGALDELVARTYALQLWRGLAACHEQLVYHRDIKPENLLLAEDWSLRVADFGLASVGRHGLVTRTCGTSGYMAPEVFKPRGGHDPARADVWAATVVTFILAMGSPPITSACRKCWFYEQILNNKWDLFWKAHENFGPRLSDDFKAFIQRGLNPVMLARPSTDSMLADPLFELPSMTSAELSGFMEHAMSTKDEDFLDSSYEEEEEKA